MFKLHYKGWCPTSPRHSPTTTMMSSSSSRNNTLCKRSRDTQEEEPTRDGKKGKVAQFADYQNTMSVLTLDVFSIIAKSLDPTTSRFLMETCFDEDHQVSYKESGRLEQSVLDAKLVCNTSLPEASKIHLYARSCATFGHTQCLIQDQQNKVDIGNTISLMEQEELMCLPPRWDISEISNDFYDEIAKSSKRSTIYLCFLYYALSSPEAHTIVSRLVQHHGLLVTDVDVLIAIATGSTSAIELLYSIAPSAFQTQFVDFVQVVFDRINGQDKQTQMLECLRGKVANFLNEEHFSMLLRKSQFKMFNACARLCNNVNGDIFNTRDCVDPKMARALNSLIPVTRVLDEIHQSCPSKKSLDHLYFYEDVFQAVKTMVKPVQMVKNAYQINRAFKGGDRVRLYQIEQANLLALQIATPAQKKTIAKFVTTKEMDYCYDDSDYEPHLPKRK